MSFVIMPISDLRRMGNAILNGLTRPIFITQRGRVKAVLLDIERYNALLDELDDVRDASDPDLRKEIAEAETAEATPLEDVLKRYGL
jgi:PHD/YefM family antitoxin component YafN of YafNO toxin-antitoxin module